MTNKTAWIWAIGIFLVGLIAAVAVSWLANSGALTTLFLLAVILAAALFITSHYMNMGAWKWVWPAFLFGAWLTGLVLLVGARVIEILPAGDPPQNVPGEFDQNPERGPSEAGGVPTPDFTVELYSLAGSASEDRVFKVTGYNPILDDATICELAAASMGYDADGFLLDYAATNRLQTETEPNVKLCHFIYAPGEGVGGAGESNFALFDTATSLEFPGLLTTEPLRTDLRYDDPTLMEGLVWVSENNEACDHWTSSYAVLAGDPNEYLRDCTEWQVPPGATFDITFEPRIGAYWNTSLDVLVAHNPVLAARMEGQPYHTPLLWLAITPVDGILINVEYEDGTICTGTKTAVIMVEQSMRVWFTNHGDISAKIGIGPGGDPDSDVNLEQWFIGNDVPLPDCHPVGWNPGD